MRHPLVAVSYVSTLLRPSGVSIAASIVLDILVAIASPTGRQQKDRVDREINRFGEYTGQSFVVIFAVAGTRPVDGPAELLLSYFWIANVIYLAFVLSAILSPAAKIVAYRRGHSVW